jgi:hypothetical protein
MGPSRAACFIQGMTCLGGIVILLFTLWNVRTGEADLLLWLGHWGIEITREENGIFFWLAIVLQALVGLGLVAVGIVLNRVME